MSDDGVHAVTVIAFVGSVFSPYYAWARRRGRGDPTDHVAINVAIYGPGARWAMTERGRRSLSRSAETFAVGPSSIAFEGGDLVVRIDEMCVPVPRRIRGTVRVRPRFPGTRTFVLDGDGRHLWRPIAPVARVEVKLDAPSLSWSGSGYADHNRGEEPLEDGFSSWTWTRSSDAAGTRIVYAVNPRRRPPDALAVAYGPDGDLALAEGPPAVRMPGTLWGIRREVRSDAAAEARVLRTLEDTPFYARSLVASRVMGRSAEGVHESLSLDRFRSPVVQMMLPFRMPRRP